MLSLICCYVVTAFLNLLLKDRLGFGSKNRPKTEKSGFGRCNEVLFSKTVCNKFITVQDIVFIILLYCNSIPEFVA